MFLFQTTTSSLPTKHRGVIRLQWVTGRMLDGSVLEIKASDLWFERLHGLRVREQEDEEPKGRRPVIALREPKPKKKAHNYKV